MVHHGEKQIPLPLHRPDLAEELFALAVEPRILDGHGRLGRQKDRDRLVLGIEIGGV